MKKMLFGISIFFGGLLGVISFLMASLFRPIVYNGVDGIEGFLLGTGLNSTFTTLKSMMIIGLMIMVYEAYLSNYLSSYIHNFVEKLLKRKE